MLLLVISDKWCSWIIKLWLILKYHWWISYYYKTLYFYVKLTFFLMVCFLGMPLLPGGLLGYSLRKKVRSLPASIIIFS